MINGDRLAVEIRRARVPFLIYVALVAAGLAALFGILRNQTFLRPWEDHVEIRAEISDAKGLVPGKQDVRIAGVKVGVVTGSDLVDGRPVVTLAIDAEHAPIHRDARLRVRPVTPLQDMYVELERGTAAAGDLDEGDVIPEDQVVAPVDVSRVLQTFDADTRERLANLLDEMAPALGDGGDDLRAAFVEVAPFLRSAQAVSEALVDRRGELRRLVTNLGGLTQALASHDEALTRLVVRGDATLGELGRRAAPLDETLAGLPGLLASLDGAVTRLASARREIDPALAELRPAARELADGLQALEVLGAEARPALAALRPPVSALRPMTRTLTPTAAALAGALDELERQSPAFDRFTRQVVPCREMLRQFFAHTPSVTKFGNAYGPYPRGDVSFDVGSAGARSAHGLTKTPSCTDGGG